MSKYLYLSIGFLINITSYFSSKFASKLAIKLFSTPQKGKINDAENTYFKASIQEKLFYKNLPIATYYWSGAKETILLVHGWESNSFRWKDLIEILKSEKYNIVSLDAPAHGNSGGKTFNALLYSECIHAVAKKFNAQIIIGHSVGGMATIFAQNKYQLTSVKKLILLGAPANFSGVFNRYSKMMGYNDKVINAMNQYVLKHYNHLPDYFSAANFSKTIDVKGLIVHDKNDNIIPYKDALNYKAHYRNSVLITTTNLGHGLKSKTVYNHILDFLNA